MKKIATFTILLALNCHLFCQSLTASYLRIISRSIPVVPVLNGGNGSDGTDNSFSLIYEHFLKKNKFSAFASYLKFKGCTLIYFEEGGWIGTDGYPITAYGHCGGIINHRIDIGLSYNLLFKQNKFYVKPCIYLGLQKSIKTEFEFGGDWQPVNGPNYFELEPMWVEKKEISQIVPSFGIRTGFAFWKRLDISLGCQGVYAFNPYQKMYLKYQYKGVVQPTAEYKSTGTGLFLTLGIGYRFARLIKDGK